MKPLAEHGTTARAKGRPAAGIPGCPCPACRAAECAYDKRRRYLNATGRNLMVDTAPVAQHIRAVFEAGAGWAQLAAITGCSTSTLHGIRTGRITSCRRSTASKILAAQIGDAIPAGRMVPAVGSIRRLHALLAAAHSCKAITLASTVEHSMISDLVNERVSTVKLHVAERIADGFRQLAGTTGSSARSRNRAMRNNWAPPAAWDDGAVDDPNAHPDWTGFCGTDRGWWTHRLQKLAMCGRCETAHADWLQAHKHLCPGARYQALGRARAEASNRGAAIAEDARELIRLGADYETAAQRIGVTRQHLQQELIRHPELRKEAA